MSLTRRIPGEALTALAERDDLSTRSLPLVSQPPLPMLPGAVYAQTTEPVRALIFDEMCEQLDFDPTGFEERT